jgi:uncharacterized GH25 family protein
MRRCFLSLWVAFVVPLSAEEPRMRVQLVEPGWLPVPTHNVQVTPVSSCSPSARTTGPSLTTRTDRSGYASFQSLDQTYYRIQVSEQGGFASIQRCVRLSPKSDDLRTAYVQLQLKLAGFTTVY